MDLEIIELKRAGMVPGLQLTWIEKGARPSGPSFGLRDASAGQAVTNETVFEAASLGRPLFAYGALKLADRGELELDRPLTEYLPKTRIEKDGRLEQVTCLHLLSHSSGFPNRREEGEPLTSQFFGMRSSSYFWRDDYESRAARGHDAAGEPCEKNKPGESNVAGSLHTRAGDYALFVEALLNGVGLAPETLLEMERPQVAVGTECAEGAALWHWGNNGVFHGFVAAFSRSKKGRGILHQRRKRPIDNGKAAAIDPRKRAAGIPLAGTIAMDECLGRGQGLPAFDLQNRRAERPARGTP
jgi:CubicO group peptidase (beta-lactamase class C family)